jgi:hypothetical protein
VSCGEVITGNETLTGNLFCILNDPVLTIDGGSLDMNGYQIGCLPGQDGVAMINSGGKLKNGSVEGCDRGVVLAGTGKHTVTNVLAKGGSDTGFFILGSGNKLIKNVAEGFADDGFRAATALPPLSDVFIDNVSANNGDAGFRIDGDKTKMTGNVAIGNGTVGILINGQGNKVSRSIAYDNGQAGLYVDGSESSVQGNVTIGNGTGVVITSAQTKVKSNTSIANNTFGFSTNADENLYSGNVAILNADLGLGLLGDQLQISKSSAILNGGYGLFAGSYTGAQVKGSRLISNGDVGLSMNGTAAVIGGNLAYDNVNDDAQDASATCAGNIWKGNVFGITSSSCIE